MKPEPLLPTSLDFQSETYEALCLRYTGFGMPLFAELKASIPSVFNSLLFYRATGSQESDVYAVCHLAQTKFAIQLDPDCEVICLWDDSTHIEIGTWESNPSLAAIGSIKRNFMNASAT